MNLFCLNTLQRGILLRIFLALLTLTVTLLLTFALSQSPRLITIMSTLGLSESSFLYYNLIFLIPSLVVSMPAILLISICYVYKNLDQQSQIIGMRSIGISNWQIMKPAFVFASGFSLFALVAVGFLLPLARSEIKIMPTTIDSKGISNFLKPGLFNPLRSNIMIYLSEKSADNSLKGILVQDKSHKNKIRSYIAEKGHLEMDSETKWLSIVMKNGTLQEVDLENSTHQSVSFSEYRFLMKPGFLGNTKLNLQDQNMWSLVQDLTSGKNTTQIFWEIERRIVEALSLLTVSTLVILSIMVKSKHIPFMRFFLGVSIGYVYTTAIWFFGDSIVKNNEFNLWALIVENSLFLASVVLCLVLLIRMKSRGRI